MAHDSNSCLHTKKQLEKTGGPFSQDLSVITHHYCVYMVVDQVIGTLLHNFYTHRQ